MEKNIEAKSNSVNRKREPVKSKFEDNSKGKTEYKPKDKVKGKDNYKPKDKVKGKANYNPGDKMGVKTRDKSQNSKQLDIRQSSAKWKKDCPFGKKCGACDYIGMEYSEQLKVKQKRITQLYSKICESQKIKADVIHGSKEPLYYRNKVHSVLARTLQGKVIRGMYKEDSHEVTEVHGCMLEDKTADRIIEVIKNLLVSFKIKIFDEDTGTGLVRHILVRMGQVEGKKQIMAIIVTADPVFPSKSNFVKALRTEIPEITTIIQNVNPKRTSMVLGTRNIIWWGKGYIEDELMGLKFRVSPGAFYQVNPVQTKEIYSVALEMAGLTGKETVLDAYCGTGTIGMIMAGRAQKVIGVELNPDAVKDAISNARNNNVENISFINEDATRYMQLNKMKFDVLCMDPPRSGSTTDFIHAACQMSIKRIVYVSCNPETQVRDLDEFIREGYRIERIVPIDNFPQTEHVETAVLITRKDK